MCVFDKVSTFYRLLIWSISYSSTITRKGLQQRKPWYPSLAHIHEEKFIHFYNTSYFKTRLCWKYLFLYMFAGSSIFQSGKKLWEQQVKVTIATICAKVHANDPLADLVGWAQLAPPRFLGSTARGTNFQVGLKKNSSVRVGRGLAPPERFFGVFLGLEDLILMPGGGLGLPHQIEGFFFHRHTLTFHVAQHSCKANGIFDNSFKLVRKM